MSCRVNSTYRISLLTQNGTRMTMSLLADSANPDAAYLETKRKLGLQDSEDFQEWEAHEFLPGDLTVVHVLKDISVRPTTAAPTTPAAPVVFVYKNFPVALTL